MTCETQERGKERTETNATKEASLALLIFMSPMGESGEEMMDHGLAWGVRGWVSATIDGLTKLVHKRLQGDADLIQRILRTRKNRCSFSGRSGRKVSSLWKGNEEKMQGGWV